MFLGRLSRKGNVLGVFIWEHVSRSACPWGDNARRFYIAYSYCLQLVVNADPRMRSEALLGRDHRTLFVDLRNSNLKPAPGIHFYE